MIKHDFIICIAINISHYAISDKCLLGINKEQSE